GVHALLARRARADGWRTSLVAFPGYAVGDRVRVLGRALLAPPGPVGDDLGHRGWRRLLTLEEAGAEVEVVVGGVGHRVRCDENGLLDVSLEVPGGTGGRPVLLRVPGREPVQAPVRVFDARATAGVVCDVDDTVWLTGIRHPWRAAWRTFAQTGADRRPVHGMDDLLRHLVAGAEGTPGEGSAGTEDATTPGIPVVYLSNGPWNMAPPLVRFLARHGFPPGALLMTDWGLTRTRWFRDGQAHKRGTLEQLRRELPQVRWSLVGDDGEHDPELYVEAALAAPAQVAAVLLRQVAPLGGITLCGTDLVDQAGGVPVVRAPDGEELLRLLRERRTEGTDVEEGRLDAALRRWFLSAEQRGNDRTRLPAWSTGNRVQALVHGRTYFPQLAAELAAAGPGDLVMVSDWRGDPDELLTDDGPTVTEAFAGAARRGANVKGLLWRSHLDSFRFSSEENRDLSEGLAEDDAEVLLDQRVRPMGSHHQKFVVVRHGDDPSRDVAFLGGIDLAHSRRDDARHEGDEQEQPHFARAYGTTPAWHDVQLRLHGPVVRDVEDTFRERWEDPAVLSRLPWQVLPDLLRGADRDPDSLPAPAPPPPPAGSCAVQLLRTYPNRWPGYPFAPDGERTAARGYAKALLRARRLVYVEDQYMWSTDVAQVFAEALRRSPDLHLVVVVPRHADQDGVLAVPATLLGHTQALQLVREAGGERVRELDVENPLGEPVYVHAKVCVIDDVWCTVGSDNFNRRSWTHDSELTAAVLDAEADPREPRDPAGLGDGARRFARDLRLELWREHLDRADGDDADLVDPVEAVDALWRSALALDAWHAGGQQGPRPPGRLRPHRTEPQPVLQRWAATPLYRTVFDPDGRPPRMKLRGLH
ncbi:phosphatase domain-containing protein, partial [Aquipuribacter hungaricus]